ncbi:hypothetical protein PsYK624_067390 [Phanerochaete sordida]|uniref:Uncharacterized protein n=1 Tax=Phanerochaete sordida TaxID=48140 RepID=A0A9P3LCV5_9APHY|nr:hypothetical protein PsYK624_067390 [Phanerochaete sordida]
MRPRPSCIRPTRWTRSALTRRIAEPWAILRDFGSLSSDSITWCIRGPFGFNVSLGRQPLRKRTSGPEMIELALCYHVSSSSDDASIRYTPGEHRHVSRLQWRIYLRALFSPHSAQPYVDIQTFLHDVFPPLTVPDFPQHLVDAGLTSSRARSSRRSSSAGCSVTIYRRIGFHPEEDGQATLVWFQGERSGCLPCWSDVTPRSLDLTPMSHSYSSCVHQSSKS